MSMAKKHISLGETVLTSRVREKMSSDALFVDFIHNCLDQHSHGGWKKSSPREKPRESNSDGMGLTSAYTYPGDKTKIRIITENEQTATVVRIAD